MMSVVRRGGRMSQIEATLRDTLEALAHDDWTNGLQGVVDCEPMENGDIFYCYDSHRGRSKFTLTAEEITANLPDRLYPELLRRTRERLYEIARYSPTVKLPAYAVCGKPRYLGRRPRFVVA